MYVCMCVYIYIICKYKFIFKVYMYTHFYVCTRIYIRGQPKLTTRMFVGLCLNS